MSDRVRIRREEPRRTGPIRNVSMLVRPAPVRRKAGSRGRVERAVEQGVENAYRVHEEYMRRGRAAAGDHRDEAGRRPRGYDDDGGFADQAMRAWADMAEMWLSAVSPLARGRGERGGRRHGAGEERDEPRAARKPEISVAVEISSAKPAEVTIDLLADPPGDALRIQPLSPLAGEARPITGARLSRVEGRLRLSVHVPDDQPEGAYFGVVIDEQHREARGTVRVTVRER